MVTFRRSSVEFVRDTDKSSLRSGIEVAKYRTASAKRNGVVRPGGCFKLIRKPFQIRKLTFDLSSETAHEAFIRTHRGTPSLSIVSRSLGVDDSKGIRSSESEVRSAVRAEAAKNCSAGIPSTTRSMSESLRNGRSRANAEPIPITRAPGVGEPSFAKMSKQ